MEKDYLTIASEIASVISGLVVIIAFLGFFRLTDFYRLYRICKDKKLIKGKKGKVISLEAKDIKSDFDRDYLQIGNEIYWISNHTTLRFIMKYIPDATDLNIQKKYISVEDFKQFILKEPLNIVF